MSDIFDENEHMTSAINLARQLLTEYEQALVDPPKNATVFDMDVIRIRAGLARDWPGDGTIAQVIKDVAKLMVKHKVKPESLL